MRLLVLLLFLCQWSTSFPEFLGYDSPYKFYNRRNEVMVEIAYNK